MKKLLSVLLITTLMMFFGCFFDDEDDPVAKLKITVLYSGMGVDDDHMIWVEIYKSKDDIKDSRHDKTN